MNKVQALRDSRLRFDIESNGFEGGFWTITLPTMTQIAMWCKISLSESFLLPSFNSKAKSFYKMVNLNEQ